MVGGGGRRALSPWPLLHNESRRGTCPCRAIDTCPCPDAGRSHATLSRMQQRLAGRSGQESPEAVLLAFAPASLPWQEWAGSPVGKRPYTALPMTCPPPRLHVPSESSDAAI